MPKPTVVESFYLKRMNAAGTVLITNISEELQDTSTAATTIDSHLRGWLLIPAFGSMGVTPIIPEEKGVGYGNGCIGYIIMSKEYVEGDSFPFQLQKGDGKLSRNRYRNAINALEALVKHHLQLDDEVF